MGSLKRKYARSKAKKMAKDFTKEIKKQMNLYGELDNECLSCQKSFDKKSKEHAQTWRVAVRSDSVHLYCPECWEAATQAIKDVEESNDN